LSGSFGNFEYGENVALSQTEFFQKSKQEFIEQKVSFIEVDLTNLTLQVYENGASIFSTTIVGKGREGSWWETPAGIYKVLSKETNHFSSIGKVWMPYSLNFQGNFFIHGKTYYPDGTPTSADFTGGCVSLQTDDAQKVFELVSVGTPILVFEEKLTSDDFSYQNNLDIEAKSWLIADLKNNFVIDGSNIKEKIPVASLTKLMTALVAIEYINIENLVSVDSKSIVSTSKSRLKSGEKYSVYQLLFPLLLESSNESAEALANYLGRNLFIQRMNSKAKAIGMINTNFVDPSGSGAENISTTEDLFVLAKYIYNNRRFVFDLANTEKMKKITATYGSPIWKDLGNFNNFTNIAGFVGGKNGQSTSALQTNASVFEKKVSMVDEFGELTFENRPVVFITLGSENVKKETEKMLKLFDEKFAHPDY
jgi:D-alanyl-D-alanine carboxypeptidase